MASTESVRERIREWQEQLLQLDGRNSLLNMRRSSVVNLEVNDIDTFLDRLDAKPGGLSFELTIRERIQRRGAFDAGELLADEVVEETIVPGQIATTERGRRLETLLTNLRKKDREFTEEQGINVLFLAMGQLTWLDEGGAPFTSPILLAPCDLERASPRHHFYLIREEDDVSLNETLRYRLANLGVTLPDFSSESADVRTYLDEVRRMAAGQQGWSVIDGLKLGIFQFSKLAMYEDLQALKETEVGHWLIRGLAGDSVRDEPGERSSRQPWFNLLSKDLAGGTLDDHVASRDMHLILPADYSQLQAIGAAAGGQSMVIHGPPGTGKSQTIANVIAAMLGAGQKVLFVSEKTAALDVVKRRLDQANLGVFCLDMHSGRAHKNSVYRQLKESLSDERRTRRDGFDYSELDRQRKALNQVVRQLHLRREPMGRSIFQVFGEFAALAEVPKVEFPVAGAGDLTRERLTVITELGVALTDHPDEFIEGEDSPWYSLRLETRGVDLSTQITSAAAAVREAANEALGFGARHAELVGMRTIRHASDLERVLPLLILLSEAPGVPEAWLWRPQIQDLESVAEEMAEQASRRRVLRARHPQLLDSSLSGSIEELRGLLARLASGDNDPQSTLGRSWDELVLNGESLAYALDALPGLFTRLEDIRAQLERTFGRRLPAERSGLKAVLDSYHSVCVLSPIPEEWLQPGALSPATLQSMSAANEEQHALADLEAFFFAEWDATILDLADHQTLGRFRVDYRNWWKRKRSHFKADFRAITACLRAGRVLSVEECTEALEQALDIKRRRESHAARIQTLRPMLGSLFNGPQTDWDGVIRSASAARAVIMANPSEQTVREILTDRTRAREILELGGQYRETFERIARVEPIVSPGVDVETGLTQWQVEAAPRLAEALFAIHRLLRDLGLSHTADSALEQLRDFLSFHDELAGIEQSMMERGGELRSVFPGLFSGWDTDWQEVRSRLEWTRRFLGSAPQPLSPDLLELAVVPRGRDVFQQDIDEVREQLARFNSRFAGISNTFDVTRTRWSGWQQAPFSELLDWARQLDRDPGGAQRWIRFRTSYEALEREVGVPLLPNLRAATDDVRLVPQMLRRRLLKGWLDSQFHDAPRLKEFTSTNHERLIHAFRRLDAQSLVAGSDAVRLKNFDNYPAAVMFTKAGELGELNSQLSKKRRRPVRQLFQRIPTLLLRLKPCMMMSPLAVSQYLPKPVSESGEFSFDAVIFDEASQVFPEDAIPAIWRAKQVIVVGDEKQLPPSAFFRKASQSAEEDFDDDDEEENGLKDRESILGVMNARLGRDVLERHLNVHYRSRHEHLIRFSNHHYYEDRLLVFPSPYIKVEGLGVKSDFLPSGRYDSGGQRNNRVEADRVVELVFEHMRTRPKDESLGVVALSRAQADLIERLIDVRLSTDSSLLERFSTSVREPFFVKNLENVQGDERDQIILSIGYGPSMSTGVVHNRFGPLGSETGWRRLNVAVSRARQGMTVVHSLRPSDIRVESPGATALKRYLEFVANPDGAFERETTSQPDSETDSPFEDVVKRALELRGYEVRAQVGVAGYRIDLGVLSPDGSSFDLGVECDGALYHSAASARDRDALRQSILEGLGWTIHRIWSTSWIQDRDMEMRRLLEAIERARRVASQYEPQFPGFDDNPSSDLQHSEIDGADRGESETSDPVRKVALFEEYARADLYEFTTGSNLRTATDRILNPMLERIIETEGPVHFDTVVERLVTLYGTRNTTVARDNIFASVRRLLAGDRIRQVEPFVYDVIRERSVRPRRHSIRELRRDIRLIPVVELSAAVLAVLSEAPGATEKETIDEVARQFGFERTGTDISSSIQAAMKDLVGKGEIRRMPNETFHLTERL